MAPFARIGARITSSFRKAKGILAKIIYGEYFYDFTQQNTDGFVGGDVDNRIENTSPTKPDFSFGNALEFDGVNDYVQVPNFDYTTGGNFTINLWCTLSSEFATNNPYLLGHGNTNKIIILGNSSSNRAIRWGVTGATTLFSRITGTLFGEDTWLMLTMVRNGNVFTLYKNAIQIDTITLAVGTVTLDANMQIGRHPTSSIAYWKGLIDEMGVWNTNLSVDDIEGLNNSMNGDYATNYSPENLLAYWRCNEEDEATTLVDEQGTSNGTLTNFNFDNTDGFVRHGYYKELSSYTGIVGDFDGTAFVDGTSALSSITSSTKGLIFARVKITDATPNELQVILGVGDVSSNARLVVAIDSAIVNNITGRLRTFCSDGSTLWYLLTDGQALQDNTWHTIAIVQDGVSPKMYVDGVMPAQSFTTSTTLSGWFANASSVLDNFFIGKRHFVAKNGNFWDGQISDVLIIDGDVSLTQVQQLAVRPELTKNYLVDTVGIDWADVAAFYPLCEGAGNIAYDMSDNKNHGTWTNPAYETLQSKGRQLGLQNVSRYSTFDGVNDVVNVSTPFTLSQGTIAFWFMPQQHNYNRVIGGDGSNNSYINPQIGSSKVLVRIDSNLNQMYFTDPLPMVQGQWYHIAVTFNSTTANCFVNGIACQENPFEIPAFSNTFQVFNLGRLWQNATYGKQILDDVAVWDVELTQSNIAGIFGGNSASDYSPENLQLYYKDCFINSQGVFKDISGNNNDGIPNGDMETIILPEKETIANIPYDTFGLECNSQRIIINGDTVEETFALRGNGNVRYDGHAGAFVDIKQIQFWFNPLSNTDLNYLIVDEANNALVKMVGNQILSDFALTTIYIDNVETDVVLNNVWQQVTIEFTTAQTINEFVMGSDYANTPGTFEEFSIDKLNLIKE
jgi:hypothetical protein